MIWNVLQSKMLGESESMVLALAAGFKSNISELK